MLDTFLAIMKCVSQKLHFNVIFAIPYTYRLYGVFPKNNILMLYFALPYTYRLYGVFAKNIYMEVMHTSF